MKHDSVRDPRPVLGAIVLFAAVLRLWHIGAQSVWIDEYLTLEVAAPKPGYPIWQLLLHNIHGPLHAGAVYLFSLVSTNDGWLRVPSALAGIVTVPLAFAWIRPRLGSGAACWGAFLLAINPLHLHYSQEIRNYSFAVLFAMAAAVAVDRFAQTRSGRDTVAYALCVAASVLSNFSATFSFVAQVVSYLRRAGRSRVALTRLVAAALLAVILVSPWIYRVSTYVDFGRLATPVRPGQLDAGERLRGDTTFRPEAVPYAAFAYSVGFTLGPSLRELHDVTSIGGVVSRHGTVVAWVGALFGLLFVTGIVRGARTHGRWAVVEPLLYVVIPLVATLALNWQNAKAFNIRYVLVGLPMYLALVAAGIDALRPRARAVAGVLVAATCAWSLWNHYTDSRYAKEDVRAAVHAIQSRIGAGECIFAPTVWQVVERYNSSSIPVRYVFREPSRLMQVELERLVVQCNGLWYVRARPWVDDADGRILSEIDARYVRGETLEFPGVSAIHFLHKH